MNPLTNAANKNGDDQEAPEMTTASVVETQDDKEDISETGEAPATEEPLNNEEVSSRETVRDQASSSVFATIIWTIALLLLLTGGGFSTLPLWSPYVEKHFPMIEFPKMEDHRVAGMTERLSGLENEVRIVRKTGEAINDLERERGRLGEQIDKLMKRLDEVEGKIVGVQRMVEATQAPKKAQDTRDSLQRLSGRLEQLEKSSDSMELLKQRLSMIEKSVSEAETTSSAPAIAPIEPSPEIARAIEEISQRLVMLEDKSANTTAVATTDSLGEEARAQALVLTVGRLRAQLRGSTPFIQSLNELKSLANGDENILEAIEVMAPHASEGVATLEMLRRRFNTVSGKVSDAVPVSGDGVLEKTLSSLKSLVSVRKTGEQGAETESSDTDVGLVLSKTRASLEAGDLETAIRAMESLEGQPADAAKAWLVSARNRLAVETAMAGLHVFVVSLLAPTHE